MRILAVDDNPVNLKLVSTMIGGMGVKCTCLTSGQEAIDFMTKNSADLIFMDLQMPGMTGDVAMHRIRELDDKKGRRTRIICLTANCGPDEREKFIAEGFDDYASKPVMPDVLKGFVEAARLMTEGENTPASSERSDPLKETREGVPDGKVSEASFAVSESFKDCRFVNIERALMSAGGDLHEAMAVMKIILRYGGEKLLRLEDSFDEENLEAYRIEAHAMKSDARTVGADELSDKAYALEKAAADCDVSYLCGHHMEFVGEFKLFLRELAEVTSREEACAGETYNDAGETMTAADDEFIQTFAQIKECTLACQYVEARDLVEVLEFFDIPPGIQSDVKVLKELFESQRYNEVASLIGNIERTLGD